MNNRPEPGQGRLVRRATRATSANRKYSVPCFDNQFLGAVEKIEAALLLGLQLGGGRSGGFFFYHFREALAEWLVESSDGTLRLGQ
jgi:hypothetical protein